MRFALRSLILVLLVLLAGLSVSSSRGGDNDGFVPLFPNKSLAGWRVRESKPGDKDKWSFQGDILTAKPGGGWLGSTAMHGDFVLKLEWRLPAGGNSGVFLRVPDVQSKDSPSSLGLEIQILDDNSPQYKGKLKAYQYCGGLYHFVGVSKSVFRGAGEWNAYEITCQGDRVMLVFNGEKVIDADMTKDPVLNQRPRQGFLGLQNHGTGVEFRNLLLKPLSK